MFILVKYDGTTETVRDFDQNDASNPDLQNIKEVLVVGKVLTKVTKWVAKSATDHVLEGEETAQLQKKPRKKRETKSK